MVTMDFIDWSRTRGEHKRDQITFLICSQKNGFAFDLTYRLFEADPVQEVNMEVVVADVACIVKQPPSG